MSIYFGKMSMCSSVPCCRFASCFLGSLQVSSCYTGLVNLTWTPVQAALAATFLDRAHYSDNFVEFLLNTKKQKLFPVVFDLPTSSRPRRRTRRPNLIRKNANEASEPHLHMQFRILKVRSEMWPLELEEVFNLSWPTRYKGDLITLVCVCFLHLVYFVDISVQWDQMRYLKK